MHAIVSLNNKLGIINLQTNKSIYIAPDSSQLYVLGNNLFSLLENETLTIYNANAREINQIGNVQHIIQGDLNKSFIAIRKEHQTLPTNLPYTSPIPLDTYYFEAFLPNGQSVSKNLKHSWYTNIAENTAIFTIDTTQDVFSMPHSPLNDNAKWGVTDVNGNVITPAIYDAISPFSNKIAAIKENNKWGYINAQGEKIVACTYDYAKSWNKNYGIVMHNNKWGIIDNSEEIILPLEYTFLKWGAEGHILYADSLEFVPGNMQIIDIERGVGWHIKNINNNDTLKFSAAIINYLEENRYLIKMNESDNFFLLYDENLKQICHTHFQIINSFTNKFAAAKYNNKWGVINNMGEWILEPVYDSIEGLL